MTLKIGTCFAGIGGLEEGFVRAGCEVVFQIEKDPACLDVLRRHYPNAHRYTDIREVTYERLRTDLGARADVDVLIGGWPCQDISLAGRRAGLAGERSGLFFEFHRLVGDLRPRWVVAENVPGLLSSYSPVGDPEDGVPVGPGLVEMDETSDLGVVVASMADLGYGWAFRCLDAQFFGVPQRRRRVFLAWHLGEPWSAPAEVLLESDSGEGHPAASDEAWEDDAADARSGAGPHRVERGPDPAGTRRVRAGEITSALTSSDGGVDFDMAEAGHLVTDKAEFIVGSEYEGELARPITAVENGMRFDLETETWIGNLEADLEGPPATPEDPSDPLRDKGSGHVDDCSEDPGSQRAFNIHGEHSTAMTGGGNSEVGYPTDVARSMDTRSGGTKNQGQTVIVEPAEPIEEPTYSIQNGEEALVAEGVSHPLTAIAGRSGQTVMVTQEVEAGLDAGVPDSAQAKAYRKSQRAHTPDDCETWVDDDVANTLTGYEYSPARTTHAVVEPIPVDLRLATRSGTDTGEGTPGNGWGEPGDPASTVCNRPPPAVQSELTVRRLTPLECERLQGFEDGWTEWGINGAGVRVEQFDSTRYKQLGNAVAVVCSHWIARRLVAVDERLAS